MLIKSAARVKAGSLILELPENKPNSIVITNPNSRVRDLPGFEEWPPTSQAVELRLVNDFFLFVLCKVQIIIIEPV